MRIRTWLSRICLTGAAVSTVAGFVAVPSSAQSKARPATYQATGFVTAVQAGINTSPQTFVEDLVRLDAAHGLSKFGTDGLARARTAALFPGVGAQEGPALGWGQACSRGFPCSDFFPDGGFPPDYPLTAEAENPTRREAAPTVAGHTQGDAADPISFTIVKSSAIANDDEASTTSVLANLNLFPAAQLSQFQGASTTNPSLLHVESIESSTKLTINDNGQVVAEAGAKLGGVSIFGGAIKIESIVVTSMSLADADGTKKNDPKVTIVGATLGGNPIKITEQGIVGPSGAVDQGLVAALSSGVGKLFDAELTSVRLINVTDESTEGTARGDAVGLAIRSKVDLTGFPSGTAPLVDLVLGTAATTAFADGEDPLDDGEFDDEDFDFDDGSGFEDFGTDTSGAGPFTQVLSDSATNDDIGTEQAAGPVTESGGRTVTRFAPLESLLQGAAADRLTWFYLAWTLGMLGLALGSRLHPFRLGQRR